MISYEPVRLKLVKEKIKRMEFTQAVGISSATASRLFNDAPVSLDVIDRVCSTYGWDITDVVEHIKEDKDKTTQS